MQRHHVMAGVGFTPTWLTPGSQISRLSRRGIRSSFRSLLWIGAQEERVCSLVAMELFEKFCSARILFSLCWLRDEFSLLMESKVCFVALLRRHSDLSLCCRSGGRPAERGKNLLRLATGRVVDVGSKNSVQVKPGDIFILRTPGGGGYGPPE